MDAENCNPLCWDFTFDSPEANVAADEALLDWCDSNGGAGCLRFWEPAQYFVVVGYANRVAVEVNVAACREKQVPILRRCTGGGTVLQGPGCLNYSLVLPIDSTGPLRSIATTNQFVMGRNRAALAGLLGQAVEHLGHTDLALAGRKFSGNAQRRKQRFLLFHGSFLLRLDLSRVEEFLRPPSRQPEYRAGRSHREFLVNVDLPAMALKRALAGVWEASGQTAGPPPDRTRELVHSRYGQAEWNLKF